MSARIARLHQLAANGEAEQLDHAGRREDLSTKNFLVTGML